jgi:hypothetical protein
VGAVAGPVVAFPFVNTRRCWSRLIAPRGCRSWEQLLQQLGEARARLDYLL